MNDPAIDPGLMEPLTPPRSSSRRAYFLGVLTGCGASLVLVVAAGLAAALALATLMASGHVPDTAAVPGERLPAAARTLLRDEGLLEEDERVLYFYSGGMLSFREDGHLFTDRRVITYRDDGGAFEVEQATYPEIAGIVPHYAEGFLADSEVIIQRHDGDSFVLLVCNEDDHDRRFVELLIETWQLQR